MIVSELSVEHCRKRLIIKGARSVGDTILEEVDGGVRIVQCPKLILPDVERWVTEGFGDWAWNAEDRCNDPISRRPHEPDFLDRLGAYVTRQYKLATILL